MLLYMYILSVVQDKSQSQNHIHIDESSTYQISQEIHASHGALFKVIWWVALLKGKIVEYETLACKGTSTNV